MPRLLLNYGDLPERGAFGEVFDAEMKGKLYTIRGPRIHTAGHDALETLYEGDYTCDALWELIKELIEADTGDGERMELVSCILGTLNIEWV